MEPAVYEIDDHRFRSQDLYAAGKYDITLRWLAEKGLTGSGKKLLNIGCGAGDFSRYALEAGFEVVGFEPEPAAFALSLAACAGKVGCKVENKGIFEIDENAHAADVIVMHDVLEHIEAEVMVIEKLHTLLKPGGTLILSVPALQWLFGRHDEQLGHYRRYGKSELARKIGKLLRVEKARYYGFLFIPIVLVFSVWLRRSYPRPAAGEGVGAGFLLLRLLCAIEKRLSFPLGTAVIVQAEKPAAR